MSDSLAVFRRRRSDELTRLADEHLQHDLQPDDREMLKSAASTVSWWTAIGSTVGVGLGLYIAFRFRTTRKALFDAFRAQEKPTHVVFAGGRSGMSPLMYSVCITCGNRSSRWHTEAVPDITPLLKPSTLGDFATYFFASAGGLFLGGELGKCTPSIVVVDQSPQNKRNCRS